MDGWIDSDVARGDQPVKSFRPAENTDLLKTLKPCAEFVDRPLVLRRGQEDCMFSPRRRNGFGERFDQIADAVPERTLGRPQEDHVIVSQSQHATNLTSNRRASLRVDGRFDRRRSGNEFDVGGQTRVAINERIHHHLAYRTKRLDVVGYGPAQEMFDDLSLVHRRMEVQARIPKRIPMMTKLTNQSGLDPSVNGKNRWCGYRGVK